MNKIKQLHYVMFTLMIFLSMGCAKKQIVTKSLIPDGSVLSRTSSTGALVWIKPAFDPSLYDQLMIDSIELAIPDKTIRDSGIPLAEYQSLVVHFEQEIRAAMAERYAVVDLPGPRIVRMRAAITDVDPSSPVLYSLTLLNPVGLVLSYGSRALNGQHSFVGGASVEMVFSDSMTGEVIAMIKDRKSGDKFDTAALSRLGQARNILRDWAVWLRDQADLQRGNKP